MTYKDSAILAKADSDQIEAQTREIVRRIKDGDQRAFSEIVRLYRNQVAALAYRVVNDYDDAADIVQDVFVKTSQNIWRYDENKKFYTWLYRITLNASIDYLRKHKRHQHEPIDDVRERTDSRVDTPDAVYRKEQLNHHLSEAIASLTGKQRSAFILRDVDGCHIKHVSDIMNMPEATVRWYLYRARQTVRKELLERCPQLLLAIGLK
ncbi:MAG: sigma-70 family RNA polymerase sigma factor [Candidatus Zixiibacteriota bacterium]